MLTQAREIQWCVSPKHSSRSIANILTTFGLCIYACIFLFCRQSETKFNKRSTLRSSVPRRIPRYPWVLCMTTSMLSLCLATLWEAVMPSRTLHHKNNGITDVIHAKGQILTERSRNACGKPKSFDWEHSGPQNWCCGEKFLQKAKATSLY